MMWLSEVAKAVNGRMIGPDVRITCVDRDSRAIVPGQLFVAIKGERFDGHQFAADALKQGASAALVSMQINEVTPCVLVGDTRIALGQLANAWRKQMQMPVIAVTGSNGKTTTKEMIASILAEAAGGRDGVHATVGNLNNDIGMPITLLGLRAQHKYAVIEMGMNHLGEIDYLTHIARPNVAVINNAGIAHIGELGSRENIAKAKGEIFAGLDEHGVAVINADDAFANYWQSLNSERKVVTFSTRQQADVTASFMTQQNKTDITLAVGTQHETFSLGILGTHNVYNALAASAVAIALGIHLNTIALGLEKFTGVHGRLETKAGLNGASLIDDTYNANPDSMKAAIDVLAMHPSANKIFVMGDMGELGPESAEMHTQVGLYAREKQITRLFGFGDFTKYAVDACGSDAMHFSEISALAGHVRAHMEPDTIVLVKGSRFMRMERLVAMLEVKQNNTKTESGESLCC